MGAEQFMDIGEGKTAADAFAALRSDAQYERGHGGYTGTIAEKDGFVTLEVAALEGASPDAILAYVKLAMYGGAMARDEGMERLIKAAEDKWGPAGHIPLGDGRHLFFGWASS